MTPSTPVDLMLAPRDPSPSPRHTSTRSSGGACVEAGPLNNGTGRVVLRHSKHPDGPVIVYTHPQWDAFIASLKDHQFNFAR